MSPASRQAWLQLVATCDDAELLESTLLGAGAIAVTLRDPDGKALDDPEPDAPLTWPGAQVSALFPAGTDAGAVGRELETALGTERLVWRTELIEDRDWVRAWMRDYQPMQFGRRLWVCPHHAAVTAEDAVIVHLDPGMAFGTGTHATTALCLEWLDAQPPTRSSVLDYGCGSGVLAVAAARLGASAVQAVDIERQALTATAENAENNTPPVPVRTDVPEAAEPADIVLANILAAPLITLAPTLTGLVHRGGRLILSGILAGQAETVQAAYAPDIRFEAGAGRDGWVRLDGTRAMDDGGG